MIRIHFASSGSCDEWTKRLLDEMSPPVKIEDIFGFAHFAWSLEGGVEESEVAGEEISWFRSELARLRFDLQGRQGIIILYLMLYFLGLRGCFENTKQYLMIYEKFKLVFNFIFPHKISPLCKIKLQIVLNFVIE